MSETSPTNPEIVDPEVSTPVASGKPMGFLAKIFGTKNDRELKPLAARAIAIGLLEDKIKAMSDDAMAARIAALRNEIGKEVKDKEGW